MDGSLTLRLAPVDGRTRPTHVVAVPPVQCSRARYDQPDPATIALTLMHLGGMLQGDQIEYTISLETGASAHLSTAAATQVYRMPEREAGQRTRIELHPNTRLHYLPEPIILFAEARFSQATSIILHEDARLVFREIVLGGRLARGELHQYERYQNRFEVYDPAGRCLVAERALLEPARFPPAATGIQGGHPVAGSVYLLARGEASDALVQQAWAALRQHPQVLGGAGALPNNCGVLVRVLGHSASAVRAALDAAAHSWLAAPASVGV